MLAGFCLSLAGRGYHVSVVCRSREKFERNIAKKAPQAISPIYVNYRNDTDLTLAIEDAVAQAGSITRTVAWIHPEQSKTAAGVIAKYTKDSYFAVLGSTDGQWNSAKPVINSIQVANPSLNVHVIALGHMRETILGTTRWLTNKEISVGVLAAFDEAIPRFVVGTLN